MKVDTKPEKKSKKNQKEKKEISGGAVYRQSDSTATCSGTSLGDSCLTSLKAAMKYDRDKIASFRNQLQRAKDFNKTMGGKAGKMDLFTNTTTYLLIALGGNMSNINCTGDTSLTEDAKANYDLLANCSKSVDEACAVPEDKVNYTLLASCGASYKKVQDKNNDCLDMKTNGTAICECWEEANTLTSAAKATTKSDGCDAKGAQSDMKDLKNACTAAFGKCKKAEDESVRYIMVCSGDANVSADNSTISTNSTVSTNSSATTISSATTG